MKKTILRIALVSVAATAIGSPALASHGWGTYHWAKGTDPVSIRVGNNVSPTKWDAYLFQAMEGGPRQSTAEPAGEGWNDTIQIKSTIVAGSTNPKNCRAVFNTIQVCSGRYGGTGWLGVAQIWISGGHIVQGTTKVNDTYFDTAKYNTPGWKMMVMCQEIGHDYGLGHVNVDFNNPNTGTCMDYTNGPARNDGYGTNEYINQHDKEQLAVQYHESGSIATGSIATNFGVREVGKAVLQGGFSDNGIGGDTPASWGRAVSYDGAGRPNVFALDMGGGRRKVTHVFWAIGEGPKGGHDGH